MSSLLNSSAAEPTPNEDVDYVPWNTSAHHLFYYYDDLADHFEFHERFHTATRSIEAYCMPVLLFFGFAATLAMLVMTVRARLVRYHYICIYLTGLASVNLLRLMIRAAIAGLTASEEFSLHHTTDWFCKLSAHLAILATRDSHRLLLPVLLLDRCLATLRDFTSPTQRGCGWVASTAAHFCGPLAAKLSTVAVFVALVLSNLWIWWAFNVEDGHCYSRLLGTIWHEASSLLFWFMAATAIVAGNVLLIVCLKTRRSDAATRPPTTETSNQTETKDNSMSEQAATTIVQAISVAFLISTIPVIGLHINYTVRGYFNYKALNILHLLSDLLDVIYLLVIPFVFFLVLRRVVVEEIRYIHGLLWSALNRAKSGELTGSINDLIRLVGDAEQQPQGSGAVNIRDV